MKQNKTLDQWGPIDAKILYMSFWFLPIANSGKTPWRAAWPDIHGIFEKNRIIFAWNKEKMETQGTWVINNIILNNKARKKLWQEYQLVVNKDYKFSEKIFKIKKRFISNKELYGALRPLAAYLYKIINATWHLGIIPEVANFTAPSYLKEKLSSSVPEHKIQEVLAVLLTSKKLSYHQQSEYELLQAAEKKDLASHADKWFWVENGYYESKNLTANDFKTQLAGFSKKDIKNKLDKIINYPRLVAKRKKKIINQYKLSSEIANIANKLAYSIWWQDHRKAVALYMENTIDIFCQAAATELKINFNDILSYTAEEWLSLFAKKIIKVPRKLLDERQNLTFFDLNVGQGKVGELHGRRAQKIINFYKLNKNSAKMNGELKGIAVSRGKVSGRVKVLLSYRQADKIKQGEILVAPMTSTDYIIAMRKASAIITDVGGLMSHAAIISRELGLPCIVGTKTATQVLKDGDKVEVDANKGVVKKV